MDPQPFNALDEESKPVADALDAEYNRAYLDPVFRGTYPADLAQRSAAAGRADPMTATWS